MAALLAFIFGITVGFLIGRFTKRDQSSGSEETNPPYESLGSRQTTEDSTVVSENPSEIEQIRQAIRLLVFHDENKIDYIISVEKEDRLKKGLPVDLRTVMEAVLEKLRFHSRG